MNILTDEEFLRSPQRLPQETLRGAATVVTVQGRAALCALPLIDSEALNSALLDLAAGLYDQQKISLGKAARIAGLSYSEMIDELGRRDIATIRMAPGELQRELDDFGP